jgi:Cof subfamily protein (haloacid dehalogenase superfamily)
VIRLVALDLDGTLIGEDLIVSNRVSLAIAAAQELGVTVTLATGRRHAVTRKYAHELNIAAPLISYQGGLIQAADSVTPLYRAMMEPALVREMLDLQAQRGWHVVLYTSNDVFVMGHEYPETVYRLMEGEQLMWVEDLYAILEQHEPVKFLVAAEGPEADLIEKETRDRFEGRLEVVRSHALLVEANPLGVSKGNALRWLAAHLDIPQEQVMAVGDQGNDTPMIAWAGVGVAMGDGSPEAKAVADWIAPPLAEDGAAVAIERFALEEGVAR